MGFPKVLFWVHCCFHSIQHHLAKSSTSICILNSISMRTILSYTSISPFIYPSSALAKLNACLQDVQRWMSLSKLKGQTLKKMNLMSGSKAQRQKISSQFPVSSLGRLLHLVDSVRNLGVWLNADFSFSEHVKMTCKACFLRCLTFAE